MSKQFSPDQREAKRRIDEACLIIRSAYRLDNRDPRETIREVKAAIIAGIEDQAIDAQDLIRYA